MSTLKPIYSILIVILLLASCTGNRGGKIEEFDGVMYAPEYASGFDIRGAEGKASTLITVSNPWQGAEGITTGLFIARNGEGVPDGYTGQVLRGDAQRIVAMSSTHIAMLDAVDEVECVVGVSGMEFIYNPRIRARRDSLGDVGYDGNINYEMLIALEPDLVLLYGVNGASAMEGKLDELGIPYIYIGDYLEECPLGKAEWMVVLAEVVGRRETGIKVFDEIPKRYNALKQEVAEKALGRPTVMFNTPYRDTWFMPSNDSYVVRLVKDAGGEYIYQENTGNSSVPIDMEEAYLLTTKADIWLNVGTLSTLSKLNALCPKFTDTRCFNDGEVYNNNLRTTPAGGNDYYESGTVRPDIILRDLVKILHPELVGEEFVYHKRLK